jgi:alanine racemase
MLQFLYADESGLKLCGHVMIKNNTNGSVCMDMLMIDVGINCIGDVVVVLVKPQ